MTNRNLQLEARSRALQGTLAMSIACHEDLGLQLHEVLLQSLTLGQLGGASLEETRDSAATLLQNAEVLTEQLVDLLDAIEALQLDQLPDLIERAA